ncbi:hypothetical protein CDL15_Pgr026109 [Punica granatum]|nr:hypothetical protein CDL15_Pgr026109 [Punica granatum]
MEGKSDQAGRVRLVKSKSGSYEIGWGRLVRGGVSSTAVANDPESKADCSSLKICSEKEKG